MDKPQLHVSHITRMALCGEQYRRIYVLGQRRPPGIVCHVGTANHKAHDVDMLAKRDKEPVPSLSVTNDLVRDTVNHLCQEEGFMLSPDEKSKGEKATRGEGIDRAIRLNEVRHKELVPLIEPVEVKKKWVAVLDGWPMDLSGEIDLEEDGGFRDLKTSGRWPQASMADTSLQGDMYAMARHLCYGEPMPQKFSLDILCDVKNKSGYNTKLRQQDSVRYDWHIDVLLARVRNAMDCIEKGVFLAADPSGFICSPRFCGFYDDCPYARHKVQVGHGS